MRFTKCSIFLDILFFFLLKDTGSVQGGYAVNIGGLNIDKVGIIVPVMRTGKEVPGSGRPQN